MADQASWSALRGKSRQFLEPWEPLWSAYGSHAPAFRQRVKRAWRDIDDDTAYPFLIFIHKGSRSVRRAHPFQCQARRGANGDAGILGRRIFLA